MLSEEEKLLRRRAAKTKWRLKNPGYHTEYAKANRERINVSSAKYLAANPDYVAKWAAKNVDSVKTKKAAYYAENSEKISAASKEYRAKNLERKRATDKAYQLANLHKFNSRNSKRRAIKRNAIPYWAELDAIDLVYEKARSLKMEVDHVVPLQHDSVCGLHVWANLQLLTKSENSSKGNRHWPDMP